MQSRTPLGNLSDEELFKLLQQDSEVSGKPSEVQNASPGPNGVPSGNGSGVQLFLSTFRIEFGPTPLPAKLLWSLYSLWAKERLSKDKFFRDLTLLLPEKKSIQNQQHYLVNTDTLAISQEVYNLINRPNRSNKKEFQQKSLENFLKLCTVEEGKNWISAEDLYNLYKSLNLKQNKQSMGKKTFDSLLKLYFTFRDEKGLEFAVNVRKLKATIGKEVSPK